MIALSFFFIHERQATALRLVPAASLINQWNTNYCETYEHRPWSQDWRFCKTNLQLNYDMKEITNNSYVENDLLKIWLGPLPLLNTVDDVHFDLVNDIGQI